MKKQLHSRLAPSLTALGFAIAASLVSQGAFASAFQLTENSAMGLGRSQAGGPAAPGDCSDVVNNPAAMSDFTTQCVAGDVSAINFSAKFHGSGTDAFGDPLTGGNGGNAGTTLPVPSVYYIRPVNDRFALGLGLSIPFGFQTEYDDRWVGRYDAVTTKLQSPAITLAGSWKLSDELSIGVSIFAQRTSAQLVQDVDLGALLAQPTGGAVLPQEADGQAGLKGFSWGWGGGLGVLWKPTQADRFGFNLRSQVNNTIDGTATFLVPSNLAPLLNPAFVSGSGSAAFNTPWYANFGWWHTVNDRFSFGVTANYTHWSSFKDLQINYANPYQPSSTQIFNYKSTWFTSIGGDYKLDDRWTLRAGVAYDQTPTTDATRDPKVPDNSRIWGSVGLGWQYSENLRFDAAFVHLFVNDAKINDLSASQSTLTGAFDVSGNVLSISGQYTF
jgi:long-chain fatty acid transport protein